MPKREKANLETFCTELQMGGGGGWNGEGNSNSKDCFRSQKLAKSYFGFLYCQSCSLELIIVSKLRLQFSRLHILSSKIEAEACFFFISHYELSFSN
jgi:hypothetical protein